MNQQTNFRPEVFSTDFYRFADSQSQIPIVFTSVCIYTELTTPVCCQESCHVALLGA